MMGWKRKLDEIAAYAMQPRKEAAEIIADTLRLGVIGRFPGGPEAVTEDILSALNRAGFLIRRTVVQPAAVTK